MPSVDLPQKCFSTVGFHHYRPLYLILEKLPRLYNTSATRFWAPFKNFSQWSMQMDDTSVDIAFVADLVLELRPFSVRTVENRELTCTLFKKSTKKSKSKCTPKPSER